MQRRWRVASGLASFQRHGEWHTSVRRSSSGRHVRYRSVAAKIGIFADQKLKSALNIERITETLSSKYSVQLIDIPCANYLGNYGPYDVIIHRAVGWDNESRSSAFSSLRILQNYLLCNPQTILIDPIDVAIHLRNRQSMLQILKACEFELNGIRVFVPKTLVLSSAECPSKIQNTLLREKMSFPVIIKPIDGNTVEERHKLTMIFSKAFFNEIQPPCIVQEFHRHNGVLHKVYMTGSSVRTSLRPSLKSFAASERSSISFQSFDLCKSGKEFVQQLQILNVFLFKNRFNGNHESGLNAGVLAELSRRLRCMNVNLVGMDILVDENSGDYALIDLNYFPSYQGVQEYFAEDLAKLIAEKLDLTTDTYLEDQLHHQIPIQTTC